MTPQEFVRTFGSKEIARRCSPEDSNVEAALLLATITGADRSSWTAQQQADADEALLVLEDALRIAEARVRNDVSISSDQVEYEAQRWIGKLARYEIYDDARPPFVKEDMKDYLIWVKSRARSKLSTQMLVRA